MPPLRSRNLILALILVLAAAWWHLTIGWDDDAPPRYMRERVERYEGRSQQARELGFEPQPRAAAREPYDAFERRRRPEPTGWEGWDTEVERLGLDKAPPRSRW